MTAAKYHPVNDEVSELASVEYRQGWMDGYDHADAKRFEDGHQTGYRRGHEQGYAEAGTDFESDHVDLYRAIQLAHLDHGEPARFCTEVCREAHALGVLR